MSTDCHFGLYKYWWQMLHYSEPDLLIIKSLAYKSRVSDNLIFRAFFHKPVKIKNLEKGTALRNRRNLLTFIKRNGHL